MPKIDAFKDMNEALSSFVGPAHFPQRLSGLFYSQKQIFSPEVYNLLAQKYGAKEGMGGTTWDCSNRTHKNEKSADTKDSGSNVTIIQDERLVKFPIIGTISAGYCSIAVEEYTGEFELIPFSELHGSPDDYFVLHVKGNSMYPRLLDGDRVVVHKTNIGNL